MLKRLAIAFALAATFAPSMLDHSLRAQEMLAPDWNSGPPLEGSSPRYTPVPQQQSGFRNQPNQQNLLQQYAAPQQSLAPMSNPRYRVAQTSAQGSVDPIPPNSTTNPQQTTPQPGSLRSIPGYESPFAAAGTNPPNAPHLASVPNGYPSGYPGDVTDAGQPIGYGPSARGAIMAPSQMSPMINGPSLSQPQYFAPGAAQTVVTPDGVFIQEVGDAPIIPAASKGGKDGVLQAIGLTGTYLPDLEGNGLSVTDVESYVTLGFPFPTRESPLLVSPAFDTHIMSGPSNPDLPATLYDSYIQFRWLRRLSDQMNWIMLSNSVSPGWYSDWETNSTQALRAPAQTLIIMDWSEKMQYILGISYLDRDDIKFLPVFGFIWKPNDDFRLEAVAPRPKISVRTRHTQSSEDWWSIIGEFGGGQWAIERANGQEDILTSRDYRVILSAERKSLTGNWGSKLEIGYVFGRVFEYRNSNTPDYEPDSTLMARAGLLY